MAARVIRRVAIGAAALVVLLLGGVAAFLATLDIERFRPRIQAAAQATTGRAVTFGAMRLGLGLTPRITVRDARLANLPGGTRPHMLEVGEAELDVALLPLFGGNIAIRRLVLKAPDILLEMVNGEPNWRFSPATAPTAAGTPTTPAEPRRAGMLEIGTVEVRDARLGFPGAPAGGVTLTTLDASGRGNLSLRGALLWGGVPVSFDAEGGPLARLLGAAGPAWPLRVRAELGGTRLTAQGTMREPRGLLGYTLDISAEAASLEGLSTLLGQRLPPLTGVTLRGRVAGSGFGLPVPEAMTLTLGAATLAPGLALARLEVAMPAAAEPARISVAGSRDGQAFTLGGTMGPLGAALAGQSLGLDLTGEHLGHAVTVQGQVAQPLAGSGVDVVVTGRSPAFGQARARLAGRGAFFAEGATLSDITLEGPIATGGGELVLTRAPVAGVTGRLALSRLDVDAARAITAPPPAAVPATAPPAQPAPAASSDPRIIPTITLDFSRLPAAAADLAFSVGTLRFNARDWQAVEGRLLLANARLRLDPVAVSLPGGRITWRVAADNAGPVPQLQVSARGDGLDVAALLGAGAPVSGRGELDLDLRGQGADTRAWAAGAIGHVGLALTEGRVSPELLRRALPSQAQGLASEIGLACLAARFDVVAGIGQARTLFVDSSLGRVTGQGMVSLRDETLALRLNTDLRLPVPGTPGLRVRAPLPVSGPWSAPRFDGSAIVGGALSGQADRLLPGLGQVLGGNAVPAAMSDCGTALGLARGGRAGPVPASQAPAAEASAATPVARPQVQDLLRGLLNR